MALRFVEIHPSPSPETLNQEWVVLENTGKLPVFTRGCGMTVARKGAPKKALPGYMDPGFILQPGEKIRLCTGNPGTKAHGEAPGETDDLKNYFLFLGKPYVTDGAIITLTLRGLTVGKGEHDAAAPAGVKA